MNYKVIKNFTNGRVDYKAGEIYSIGKNISLLLELGLIEAIPGECEKPECALEHEEIEAMAGEAVADMPSDAPKKKKKR